LDIDIGKLIFNFPTEEWLATKEDKSLTERFFSAVKATDFNIVTPMAGDVYSLGGVDIEVLNHPINYDNYPSINATGIILKAHFPGKEVLFLGDFDVNSEEDYKANFSVDKLKCDIVQMAHHGQGGVSRDFYRLIEPKFCLYTAPDWLWENNKYRCTDPSTRGKGCFTIFDTRLWMAEMRVIKSFYHGEGDWLFV
jgi:beta-lactamase superfamily II metal-dependent hydrolase